MPDGLFDLSSMGDFLGSSWYAARGNAGRAST